MPPTPAAECRERTEACERVAKGTKSEHIRETMRYVASRWRALADEEDAKATPGKQQPTSARPALDSD